jgi:hypothetical protein
LVPDLLPYPTRRTDEFTFLALPARPRNQNHWPNRDSRWRCGLRVVGKPGFGRHLEMYRLRVP